MAGSMTLAELIVKIKADDKEAIDSLKRMKSQMENTSQSGEKSMMSMAKGWKAAAVLVAAELAGVVLMLKKCVNAAAESEEAVKKLNAVLASTGKAAGLSSQELQDMAGELQKVTTFSDEAIMSGQSLLLTFTKIGKDVFPKATEAMLDMSVMLGQDVRSSAIQLGKALNDPIQGVTALRRVGIQLTQQQEDQIKTYMKLGKVQEAQKIILGEVTMQMGGQARAAADTYKGSVTQLDNAIDELQETMGKRMLPALTTTNRAWIAIVNSINEAVKALDKWVESAKTKSGGGGWGGTGTTTKTPVFLKPGGWDRGDPRAKKKTTTEGGGVATGTPKVFDKNIGLPTQEEVFNEFLNFSSQTVAISQNMFSGMNEIMGMYYANKSIAIDNDLRHQMDAIEMAYDAEKKAIEASLMNKKQKTAALEALDEKRARQEKKALEKSEKEKRKIARETAKYNKAFGIIDTTMNTAMAIMAAWRYAMEWGGPAAPAIGAGLTAMLGALGAAKVALIASQPLPEFARGGLFTGPAIVAEKGREVALPLEGDEGRAAMREMAGAMLDMISTRLDTGATVGPGGASGGGNSGIYLDGRLVGEWITGASNNGQIQISNRSVV